MSSPNTNKPASASAAAPGASSTAANTNGKDSQSQPSSGGLSNGTAANTSSPSSSNSKPSAKPSSSNSAPYKDYVEDEADADDDDDEVDPRYAIDSYQTSSGPSGRISAAASLTGIASSNAAAAAAQGKGQAPGTQLPAWGSAAIARNQQSQQSQQSFSSQAGAGAPGRAPGIATSAGGRILPDHYSYATSQGWSISNLCMAAWSFPPFTSVLVLIWETENDLARFHSYQAGICGVALILLLYIMRSWLGLYTLSIIVGMAGLGWFWVCGSAAANNAPTLERVPYVAYAGPLAEQWLGEE